MATLFMLLNKLRSYLDSWPALNVSFDMMGYINRCTIQNLRYMYYKIIRNGNRWMFKTYWGNAFDVFG